MNKWCDEFWVHFKKVAPGQLRQARANAWREKYKIALLLAGLILYGIFFG